MFRLSWAATGFNPPHAAAIINIKHETLMIESWRVMVMAPYLN
jgi:hypothetical protein